MNNIIKQNELVEVALPLIFHKTFTYRANETLEIGSFVEVTFKNMKVFGIVWSKSQNNTLSENKIKSISSVIKTLPPISKEFKKFLENAAKYNLAPLGMIVKMAIPSSLPTKYETQDYYLYSNEKKAEKFTKKQTEALNWLLLENGKQLVENANTKFSKAIWQKLIGFGVINRLSKELKLEEEKKYQFNQITLSEEQKESKNKIEQYFKEKEDGVVLLDGVPGSGKSEVYFEIIANQLKENKQSLILLPEIALTSQFTKRIEARFGIKPAIWHALTPESIKKRQFRNITTGVEKIIIGARSALFLPYKELGLIIIDEEHEPSYKQEDGARYHARDMAIYRAMFEKISVLLVSATPSLETFYNVNKKKYGYVNLENRHKNQILPNVEVVDLTKHQLAKDSVVSEPLKKSIEETIERGEQVLLFLNRRGFAPITICKSCGYKIECPNCTTNLVEHKSKNHLLCHKCGFTSIKPKTCKSCGLDNTLLSWGIGVEKLEEEVKIKFPNAKCAIATSDTIKNIALAQNFVKSIENKEVDIIIGTQIIAKGYHFPNITLVGVIDADMSEKSIDMRAAERTYQLLYQVAGRAGRGDKAGKVVLQTYNVNSEALLCLQNFNRDKFISLEMEERKNMNLPPYSKLIAGVISHKDDKMAQSISETVKKTLNKINGITVFGPSPAPIQKIAGKMRYRFLIQTNSSFNKEDLLDWYNWISEKYKMSIFLDVDPLSFY